MAHQQYDVQQSKKPTGRPSGTREPAPSWGPLPWCRSAARLASRLVASLYVVLSTCRRCRFCRGNLHRDVRRAQSTHCDDHPDLHPDRSPTNTCRPCRLRPCILQPCSLQPCSLQPCGLAYCSLAACSLAALHTAALQPAACNLPTVRGRRAFNRATRSVHGDGHPQQGPPRAAPRARLYRAARRRSPTKAGEKAVSGHVQYVGATSLHRSLAFEPCLKQRRITTTGNTTKQNVLSRELPSV